MVQKNTIVSLRYIMKDHHGEVIENTTNSNPLEYLHGCGSIIPSLETALEGLAAGTKRSFTIHPEELDNPLHFDVIVDAIREATVEEINAGQPVKKGCGPDCCC